LVVVFGGENRQVSVKDFDNKFGDVGGLPFLLFGFFNK
jgi:hypothetical protein